MHYAFRIAREGFNPGSVPTQAGVSICWQHRDVNGNPNATVSRQAAEHMITGFGIVYRPALNSPHGQGKVIDMDISWTGDLKNTDGNGKQITIKSTPRTGVANMNLYTVGASYGVIKLISDPPH